MQSKSDSLSVAEVLGQWVEPNWDSGLVDRCRTAWSKPLRDLSNEVLATLLRQRLAVEYILPIAKKRVEDCFDDNTEMYDGELEAAIEYASKKV